MLIARDLTEKIKQFILRDEFISILGPRQSGKTVFLGILKDYFLKDLRVNEKSIQILTFEDRKLLMEFEADPISFVRSFMPGQIKERFYLMIDEFQYATEGGQKLKFIYDTLKGVKIIITGSSSLDIKAKVGKFMVGRILNFNLFPLNFREYLRTHNKRLESVYTENNHKVSAFILKGKELKTKDRQELLHEELSREYERFSIWGGYPAPSLAKTEQERKKLLSDIYNNYILKDIKTLLELATEKNLFLLTQNLATQVGNLISYQNLSQACGLDFRKLKNHLNILEETFICREVRPFFKNRQKELTKNPKIYFLDMGFRNNLMDNMSALPKHSDAGAIVENTCFIRLNELCQGINRINFWRTKSGAEVDFVVHSGAEVVPIEVKYSLYREAKLTKSFASFIDTFNPKHALILTKNFWGAGKRGKTKIVFMPVYFL